MADASTGSDGDCMLCYVSCTGGLGGSFRDIPCKDTRDGNGYLHILPVGGLLPADLYFPDIDEAVGASGTFWLYGAICLSGFFFIRAKLPETKGKTLEELEKELTK